MYGGVPPKIESEADPLLYPLHETLLIVLVEYSESGCDTLTLSKYEQLFVSLTR